MATMNPTRDGTSGADGQSGVRPDAATLVLRSDPEAIGRAMESCRNYLLLVANEELDSVLQRKAAPSDLVQETYLEAHRDLYLYQGRSDGDLKSWLRRILLNNLANLVRRYRGTGKRQLGREVSLDGSSPEGGKVLSLSNGAKTPSSLAVRTEQTEAVLSALGRLPERDRQVVIWRNQDQCTFEEMGERLGGSPDMARKAWSRAIERLREEVGEIYGTADRESVRAWSVTRE
jgi:RNA polymerase sigma-70 factor (ECF subfamily)